MTLSSPADEKRRRLALRLLASGALSASPALSAAAELLGTVPDRLPPGRSIHRLSGAVRVNGRPATRDTAIGPADTVETGRGAEVVFAVGTSAFLLRADSRLSLQGREERGSVVASALRLVTGALLSVFGRSDQVVTLGSPTATIGIRGTGVYLEADARLSYFCTCYGTAEVGAVADPAVRTTVQATHHDRPLYVLARPEGGSLIREAPFRNHTDQELALIEALVGRTPPFVFQDDDYDRPRRRDY